MTAPAVSLGMVAAGSEVAIVGGENDSGRTVYIPAVEEFIVELDEPRRRIIFELPEGLLDLND